MEGFKNTTRMKTFGDVAPQAYAKGGSVKPMVKAAAKAPAKAKDCAPMKKAGGGDVSKMTRDQRMASMEKSSRAMTPAETRSLQALKAAKAAAPKQGPLIGRGSISDREDNRALRAMPKDRNPMSAAEVRRLMEMDRPTNNMGAEAYKGGGKVGGSKVPFAVKKVAEGKKVMRKAMGGSVNMPEMPYEEVAPPAPMVAADYRPTPMPEMPQEAALSAPMVSPDYLRALQDRAATLQAQQEMAAQAQMDQGLGRGLAPMYGRGAPPRFMR